MNKEKTHLPYIKEILNTYNHLSFYNELNSVWYKLGIYRGKTENSNIKHILIPFINIKETISSMDIEGTQITCNEAFETNVTNNTDKKQNEYINFTEMLVTCANELKEKNFSHDLIKKIHKYLLSGISKEESLGTYKTKQNCIKNSKGTLIYTPPEPSEILKYMDELIDYMNEDSTNENYLIKAAIIHSQFESIHPFEDGNGRVGRALIGLYLFKKKVLNIPIFYISESISIDKPIYYNELTKSRNGQLESWIRYFITKCDNQLDVHIDYFDKINNLYNSTYDIIKELIITKNVDKIINTLFMYPVTTSTLISEKLNISKTQANRYLNMLENRNILYSDDSKRNKKYYFSKLISIYNLK